MAVAADKSQKKAEAPQEPSSPAPSKAIATPVPSAASSSSQPPGDLLMPVPVRQAVAKPKAARRRVLKQQSTDAQVDRCLRDNFRGWSAYAVDGRRVEGKTLREHLKHDKRAQRVRKFAMGKVYFSKLKAKYGYDSDPYKQMQVADGTQELWV